jgi:hypothetical protein
MDRSSGSPAAPDQLKHQAIQDMTWEETFRLVGTSLFSIVSAGAIIVGLASWLGKVWAERILRQETHQLQQQLRVTQHQYDLSIKLAEKQLDLAKEAHSAVRTDKVQIYREIIDLIAGLLAKLDAHSMNRLPPDQAVQHFDNFNEQRMRLYGYMAMFAPQAVMDAQDDMMRLLLHISHGRQAYDWPLVREKALALINEIRKDVGIDQSPIHFNREL